MEPARQTTLKCFFVAWIFGWVTAIYVPSLVIAAASLSPLATTSNFFGYVFAVADQVAPAAKLSFAALFAGFALAARRLGKARASVDAASGMAAMMLVVALLPEDWSRGFGIGLAGTRFAVLPTATYLGGGLLAGIVLSVSEARCRARGSKAGA